MCVCAVLSWPLWSILNNTCWMFQESKSPACRIDQPINRTLFVFSPSWLIGSCNSDNNGLKHVFLSVVKKRITKVKWQVIHHKQHQTNCKTVWRPDQTRNSNIGSTKHAIFGEEIPDWPNNGRTVQYSTLKCHVTKLHHKRLVISIYILTESTVTVLIVLC